jgi:hypothetical protein
VRDLLTPLSSNEEKVLKEIGFGIGENLDQSPGLRGLLRLELIELDGSRWKLTALGRRRYDAAVMSRKELSPAAQCAWRALRAHAPSAQRLDRRRPFKDGGHI